MTRNQFNKKMAKLIKQFRLNHYDWPPRQLTQAQLSYMCNFTPSWISHFESGRRMPDSYAYYKLCQALPGLGEAMGK